MSLDKATPEVDALLGVTETDVSDEMERSFLEYAYSVIYSRALPDARDGLKPVQRRIVYQMQQMGLKPSGGYVKSQRVVGDVMGKLHPHGDSAIYDTLVRLAQPFAMRVPLVDGHGNFGSPDDSPAAARYTEAKMTSAATEMVADLDQDVVEFVPNYDSRLMQPEVLPAAFPNLLVNGASGIAVGMATNIAPHNLSEICEAIRMLVANPESSVEDLMTAVQGPDFPTGGIIVGRDGIKEAYETGNGKFKIRARASIERTSARRDGIVVTELPYSVGPERVMEKVKQAVKTGRIKGISAITNLTDRKNGLRLVIEVKTGFSADAILDALFAHTPLEETFAVNAVALVNGQPKTLTLKQALEVYIDHRLTIIRRRSEYRLREALSSLHLLEGLLIAMLDIDDVISIVRTSDSTEIAQRRLCEVFDLSQKQAEYILSLRLRRLTRLAQLDIENRVAELKDQIENLTAILADEHLLTRTMLDALASVEAALATDRRTSIEENLSDSKRTPKTFEILDQPCNVAITPYGGILRLPQGDRSQERISSVPGHFKCTSTTQSTIALISGDGHVRVIPTHLVPELPSKRPVITSKSGVNVGEMLGEPTFSPIFVSAFPCPEPVVMVTSFGRVKRMRLDSGIQDGAEILELQPGETIVGCAFASETSQVVVVTEMNKTLKFSASAVRVQKAAAQGMTAVRLAESDKVVFSSTLRDSDHIVTLSTPTTDSLLGPETAVSVCPVSLIPLRGRGTMGVKLVQVADAHINRVIVSEDLPNNLRSGNQRFQLPAPATKLPAKVQASEINPSTVIWVE